jgi:acyl carrier protein
MMTEHEILVGFGLIVEEWAGTPASEVVPKADLADDLDIDSLSMVEVVVSMQDKFNIEIPDEDLRGLRTVQDVVVYVQRAQRSGVSALSALAHSAPRRDGGDHE